MRRATAGVGLVALLASAVGITVVQLASTTSSAATSAGILTGAGQGGGPDVHGYSGNGTSTGPNGFVYDGAFFGGARVAAGDVNGDGVDEIITGAGPGGGPHVKVFDGAAASPFTSAPLRSYFAFDGSFSGGVFVASGDVNGDGKADVIVGAGPGSFPQVRVYSGADGSILSGWDFPAFTPGYTGGVSVASGDVNGDGFADVIAGSATSDSVVSVFSGKDHSLLANFATYPGFQGGIFVGAGDINGDGKADVITGAGPGGGPHVKVFDIANSSSLIRSFFAYDAAFHGGVRVAGTDANNDGTDDILTGPGPGGGPHVKVFNGKDLNTLASFFAYPAGFAGGVYVAGHTIVASGTPKVTSTTPGTVGAGATNKDVIINGAGFQSGTAVAFSGSGITVNTTTFQDPTHIKVNISIAGSATPGARDVTVTRSDAQTAKCTGCFTVGTAPTVNSVSPNTGAQGSSNANVNINGTGFVNGAVASFSGTGITVVSTTFNSATQVTASITIASNATIGNHDVIVTNPDGGTGKFVNGFGVTAGPQVTSVSPSSLNPPTSGTSPSTPLTVTGTGFVTGANVTISGPGITVVSTDFTDAQHVVANVTVDSTAPHGARDVTVTNPANGGAGSCTGCFSIGPEPTITSVTPNAKGQGTTGPACPFASNDPFLITIKGNNFNGSSVVTFTPGSSNVTTNGVIVNCTTNPDPNTLLVSVSVASNATPGLRDVTVTNPAPSGAVTKAGAFTVNAKPVVSSASPSSMGQGSTKTVTINGSGFQNPANVGFSGSGVTVTGGSIVVVDSSHITAEVNVAPGAAAGGRDIIVVNVDGGTGVCSACFAVNAAPTVTSITPSSRAAGSAPATATIVGSGFVAGSVPSIAPPDGITLDQLSVTDASHISVRVTVASSAAPGARAVKVTNPDGGVGTCACSFTVVAAPQVNTASPNSINPGGGPTNVTLKGTGFQPAPPASGPTAVTFSGTGISYTQPPVVTDTSTITLNGVTVTAGAAPGPRDITVVNPDGGTATCTGCFSVGPLPTLSSVTPKALSVGTSNVTLALKGTNFNSTTTVSFSNGGITQNGSPVVVDPSNMTIKVNVAGNATPGLGNVTVTNVTPTAGSGTCTGCFTVDPAPTISTVVPATLKQGATSDVVINGSGYRPSATAGLSPATGVTVNSVVVNSASKITANITLAADAPTGARDVIVFNQDDGGLANCSSCFNITTGP